MKITIFKGAKPGQEQGSTKGEVKEVGDIKELNDLTTKTAWSPGVFEHGIRKKSNFKSIEVIALDFDDGVAIETIKERLDRYKYKYAIAPTKSHRKEKKGKVADRFRVLIPLKEAITSEVDYIKTWENTKKLFPEIDPSCKDTARFYFASVRSKEFEFISIKGKELKGVRSRKKKQAPAARLTKFATEFLNNPPKAGENFNTKLNKAVYQMTRCGMSEENIKEALLQNYPWDNFNKDDLTTIKSAILAGERAGMYTQIPNGFSEKENQRELFDELAKKFLIYIDSTEASTILFRNDKNELKACGIEAVMMDINDIIKDSFGDMLSAAKISSIASTWKLNAEKTREEPAALLFAGDNRHAYNRVHYVPEPGPTPVFDEILGRTTNSAALQAFIWSLLVPESNRQQYLWLNGEGANSKSSLINTINKIIGKDASLNIINMGGDSRFFTSKLFGRRLACFPDSNTKSFVTSGMFKALTGDDTFEVEFKGRNSFHAKNIIKFIFSSNNLPDISPQVADVRRIILCEMGAISGKPIPNYQELLDAEIPQILYKCKLVYDKIVKMNGPIPCDIDKVLELAEENQDPYKAYFNEFFELTDNEEDIIKRYEVLNIVERKIGGKRNFSKFKKYLKDTYEIKEKRDPVEGWIFTNVKLK